MDKEKMFNLQLTIQKLEEELSLYRNGTTAEEMFELIKEKEVEIDALKQKLLSKEDTLRRIAKSSGDVLNKYDLLLSEKTKSDAVADEFNTKFKNLEQSLHKVSIDRDQQVDALKLKNEQIVTDSAKQHETLSQTISELRSTNAELTNSITEKLKMIKEFQQAILKYETDLSDVKSSEQKCESLTKSITEKELLITRLNESAEDNNTHIDKLQKRCADLVTEKADKFRQLDAERQEMINHVQKFRESMASNISQRDEALRRKDEKVKELNFNLTVLNQDVKLKTQKIEDISAERDAFWQGKMVDLEQRLQTSEHRRQDLETRAVSTITSNSTLTLLKSENDTLKMRLMDLEEKLYRQDQQMKRRALQERTNTLTTNSSGSVSTGIHFDPADIAKPAPTLAPYSDTITASSLVASAPQRNALVTASSVLARSQSGSGSGGGGVDFSIFPDKQALSSRFM